MSHYKEYPKTNYDLISKIWQQKLLAFIILLVLLGNIGCKKLVEIDPPSGAEVGEEIYKNKENAAAVIDGLLVKLATEGAFSGNESLSITGGLSADEFIPVPFGGESYNYQQLYSNSLTSDHAVSLWRYMYDYIYTTNALIEGLEKSKSIDDQIKAKLLGQAKFFRGLFYFYLVNYYGEVPLVMSTNYKTNIELKRSGVDTIYNQIFADLADAEKVLTSDYTNATGSQIVTERIRPNLNVVRALLARVHLFRSNWEKAESYASLIIQDANTYNLETNLDDVFLSTSKEAIWHLMPVSPGENTKEGILFNLEPEGPNSLTKPIYLNSVLVKAFEPDDKRKDQWIKQYIVAPDTFYYPFKYKVSQMGEPVTEYLSVFRLAEQYLIRSEARTHLNNLNGPNSATEDLDIVRQRAGLLNTTAATQDDLLSVIYKERQIELFSEFGHRWLDLKRSGLLNSTMDTITPLKGGEWKPYKQLFPIYVSEMALNRNLLPNNPGY